MNTATTASTRDPAGTVGFLTSVRAGRRVTVALLGFVATLYIGALPTAFAGETQPLDAVERAAERFVVARAGAGEASAQTLDRRLRLARCDAPLEAFLRPGTRLATRTVVGVRCPGSSPWKVYVPVNLVEMTPVVVVAHALPRGHVLTAADLSLETRDSARLPGGYAQDAAEVVGQTLRQSVRAGAVLSPSVLSSRVLVRRGQSVTLKAANAAVQIRVAGKALADGALNQRIRVQNVNSGRIVEGLVRSRELVEVIVQ